MRVLFDHSFPFALAHGGFQIQIEQTAAALHAIGIEVEFLRWWDERQRGDFIHYFGRPTEAYVQLAQQKGMRVVIADLLTGLGSRSRALRFAQKALTETIRRALPASFSGRMGWAAFSRAGAVIALTQWEARLMREMFGVLESKIHVIPNGVEELFFQSAPRERGSWLVCTATIAGRKRVLELARAATIAKIPIWILGKPYSSADPYAVQFERFANSAKPWIRYEGPVEDRTRLAEIYREARGFVLLSTMESLSLSALEAAACGCPLLLSDLPWARTVFESDASYCAITTDATRTATVLRKFYDEAPRLKRPPKPKTWNEVAQQLRALYERLLTTSR